MIFVELFAPRGTLGAREREELAERLMTDVSFEEPALPVLMETAIGNAEVVVHEPHAWSVAGGTVGGSRFLVRVAVPEQWREGITRPLVSRLTRVLKGATGWGSQVAVQIVGVPLVEEPTAVGVR